MEKRERNVSKKHKRETFNLNTAVVIYLIIMCLVIVAFAVWLETEHQILELW